MVKIAFNEFLNSLREQISWAAETTHGTPVTPTDIVGYDAKITPDWNQNWQEIMSSGADVRTTTAAKGPLSYPFTLTFIPVDWKFLKYCGYTVADAGGPTYTHTFTLANTIMSFTLEWAKQHTTDHVLTIDGAVVNTCNIAFTKAIGEGTEGFIQVTLRCFAKTVTQGSSVTTISAITASPFQWRHAKLTIDNTEITELNSGNILIDDGKKEDDCRYCSATLDREIGEPIPTTHKLTGTFNVNIKDKTFYDLWATAATISNCKLEFVRGANDDVDMTLSGFKLIGPGAAPTEFEKAMAVDLNWRCDSLSSFVATDAISTY